MAALLGCVAWRRRLAARCPLFTGASSDIGERPSQEELEQLNSILIDRLRTLP